jgi:hypothetical protein
MPYPQSEKEDFHTCLNFWLADLRNNPMVHHPQTIMNVICLARMLRYAFWLVHQP